MATRGLYKFEDDDGESFVIYSHYDNYPSGAKKFIINALDISKSVEDFEASEFAAAFIAANKKHAGGFYLTNETSFGVNKILSDSTTTIISKYCQEFNYHIDKNGVTMMDRTGSVLHKFTWEEFVKDFEF